MQSNPRGVAARPTCGSPASPLRRQDDVHGQSGTPVFLNVYDLTKDFAAANRVMKCIGTGVYHCGVEVHGTEWTYSSGSGEDDSDEDDSDDDDCGEYGILEQHPRQHEKHKYKQSVDMGITMLSPSAVQCIITELKADWRCDEYHLLQHNCCDFCNALCKRLGVGHVPGWVKSAAGLGAVLDDVVHARHVSRAVDQGKKFRGRDAEDAYRFGDLSSGVASTIADAMDTMVQAGYQHRIACGGSENVTGYRFGDFSRGLASCIPSAGSQVLAEGKTARDASQSTGYTFGDITRGAVSSLAKR